jgi:CheY-like chemotaxis protein
VRPSRPFVLPVAESTPNGVQAPRSAASPLTLIIERDATNARLFSALVESVGYTAVCAETLAEGLDLAITHTPDAVVLDAMLARDNLAGIITALGRCAGQPRLPVLGVTTIDTPSERRAWALAGGTGLFLKPIPMALFTSALIAQVQALRSQLPVSVVIGARPVGAGIGAR